MCYYLHHRCNWCFNQEKCHCDFYVGRVNVKLRNLLLTAFSVHHNDPSGQVFVFFIMALAAAEVAVGLAIIVMVYRNTQSIDINVLNRLKW